METKIAGIIVIGICFVIASFGGCSIVVNHQDNTAMVEMVKAGADPFDANCAIKGNAGNSCVIRAASKNK